MRIFFFFVIFFFFFKPLNVFRQSVVLKVSLLHTDIQAEPGPNYKQRNSSAPFTLHHQPPLIFIGDVIVQSVGPWPSSFLLALCQFCFSVGVRSYPGCRGLQSLFCMGGRWAVPGPLYWTTDAYWVCVWLQSSGAVLFRCRGSFCLLRKLMLQCFRDPEPLSNKHANCHFLQTNIPPAWFAALSHFTTFGL